MVGALPRRLVIPLAAAGAIAALAAASPSPALAASGPASQKAVGRMLLPLEEIRQATGVDDLASSGVTCHHAPYYSGSVNYCYHDSLVSPGRQASDGMWANHVDVIALQSPSAAQRYLRETKHDRADSTIGSSTDRVVLFDRKAVVKVLSADGRIDTVKAPVVSVYAIKGANAVYTECADPGAASSSALRRCAADLAQRQLARLP